MRRAAAVVGVALAAPAVARAEHDHAAMMASEHAAPASSISASVMLEAASFDNPQYIGSYQAIMPALAAAYGRFGASASIGVYHLEENGLDVSGLGDTMAGVHAVVWRDDAVTTGVTMHVMLPTGSELDNLGMGHIMVMPSAWGAWQVHPRVKLAASAGYSRAAISFAGGVHDHGPTPLVDPMNLQEVAWSAGADVDVGARFSVGGRANGGIPIGTGHNRVIGGGRVAWGTPRVSTGLELQAGIAGDPFTIRGVVDTALRF